MAIVVVTPPSEEPVSLDAARAQVRVDSASDDALITSLIVAAREFCEGRQNRFYVTQTVRYSLDCFPHERRVIDIPRPPLQSVTSVTYKDAAGVTNTLGTTLYAVDTDSFVGRVALMPGACWPAFIAWPVNAIAITYVAGYGNASKVPQPVKQAMLMLVAHWYENREASVIGTISKEIEFSVNALLGIKRVTW